jgi:hypothetical protein
LFNECKYRYYSKNSKSQGSIIFKRTDGGGDWCMAKSSPAGEAALGGGGNGTVAWGDVVNNFNCDEAIIFITLPAQKGSKET